MLPSFKKVKLSKGRKVDAEPPTEGTSSAEAHSPWRSRNLESMRKALFQMPHRRGGVAGILSPKKGDSSPDKSRAKSQLGGDDDDDDDEEPEHMPFLLVAGGVAAALGILFIGVWTFSVMIGKALQVFERTETLRNRHLIRELLKACTSKECREAVSALNDSVRVRGVDPCSDFYNFSCGLWNVSQQGLTTGGNHSGTYHQWLEDSYVASVHAKMLRMLPGAENSSEAKGHNASGQVAHAYNACFAFFTNVSAGHRLAPMWKAARVDPYAWMRAVNFSQLFAYVIEAALDSNLITVLRIDYDKHGTVRIQPGNPIEQSSGESGLTIALLEEASSTLGLLYEREIRIDVARLDGVVRKIAHSQPPAQNQLPPPLVDKEALDLDTHGIR
ncbi:uncharacterized protein LOC144124127 [Amblyomma americanum]